MRNSAFVASVFILVATALPAQSQVADTVAQRPVERTITGSYACTTVDEAEPCGSEDWIMTVQGDGTRTLRAYSYVTPIAFQNSTVMRVDRNFRPLDGFSNLYRDGQFFGSGFFVVDGNALTMTVNAPGETLSETIPVPDDFVLLLYPNSAYGWMLGAYDFEDGGVQNVTMCVLAAAQGRSASCVLVEEPLEYIGDETITVPAGNFDTRHFKIGKNGDTWISGADRIVVQHQHRVRNLRFQLTAHSQDD